LGTDVRLRISPPIHIFNIFENQTNSYFSVENQATGHLSEIENFCSGYLSDSFGGHLSDGL
jgi:hypothetical protein